MYKRIPRPLICGFILIPFSLIAGCQRLHPQPPSPARTGDDWAQLGSAEFKPIEPSPLSVDPADGITLEEGEWLALQQNPTLRLLRLRAGISEATARHSGRWRDPQLGMDATYSSESIDDPWVLTGSLAFTIPISGRLGSERGEAVARHAVDLNLVSEAEWDVLHQVRRAWIQWSATLDGVEILADTQRHLDGLVESTQGLAIAGEMPRTEASLFPIERIRLQMLQNQLTMKLAEQQTALATLLGFEPQSDLVLEPVPLAQDDGDLAIVATNPIDANPTLLRLRGEVEAARQRLEMERRTGRPDITLGPIVESDEGQGRVGGMVAIPLPVFQGNRQAVAEAEATLRYAQDALDAASDQQARKRDQAERSLRALHRQYEEMLGRLAPLVQQQFTDAMRLHELGEGSGLVLLESLVQSYETRLKRTELERDISLAQVQLHYVSGPAAAASAPHEHSN